MASTEPTREGVAAPGVERVFGTCSEHGPYELPLGSIDHGEIARCCPACAPVAASGLRRPRCVWCGRP